MGGPRIDQSKLANIRKMYEEELLSCEMIAKHVGCSRARIWQLLKAQGVATHDHKRESRCVICGKQVLRTRARIRGSRRVYCGQTCYWAHVGAAGYQANRQGQRVARAAVAKIYNLQPSEIVHHIDGNNANNDPRNLVVFASHADHMRYHRTDLPVRAFSLAVREHVDMVNPRYTSQKTA